MRRTINDACQISDRCDTRKTRPGAFVTLRWDEGCRGNVQEDFIKCRQCSNIVGSLLRQRRSDLLICRNSCRIHSSGAERESNGGVVNQKVVVRAILQVKATVGFPSPRGNRRHGPSLPLVIALPMMRSASCPVAEAVLLEILLVVVAVVPVADRVVRGPLIAMTV